MPNYCDNGLLVKGSPNEIHRFYRFAQGFGCFWGGEEQKTDINYHKFFDFSQFIKPTEEELKKGYSEYGYDWCCDNWGTKWNSFDLDYHYEEGDDEIAYSFNTAWSPMSTKLLNRMEELFPSLKFEYTFIESGCEFYGKWDDETKDRVIFDFPEWSTIEELLPRVKKLADFCPLLETYEGDEESRDEDILCELHGEIEQMFHDMDYNDIEEIDAESLFKYIEGKFGYAS